VETLAKFVTIGYASLAVLLGWLGAIVGFLLLACGIAGAIIGQVIWVVACDVIVGARGKLERTPAQTGSANAPAIRVE
jgi:hypothetical protein